MVEQSHSQTESFRVLGIIDISFSVLVKIDIAKNWVKSVRKWAATEISDMSPVRISVYEKSRNIDGMQIFL